MTIGDHVCTCENKQPHQRPSGAIVCLYCGLPIVPKPKPEDRP